MDLDLRLIVVLLPVILAGGWAVYNIGQVAIRQIQAFLSKSWFRLKPVIPMGVTGFHDKNNQIQLRNHKKRGDGICHPLFFIHGVEKLPF